LICQEFFQKRLTEEKNQKQNLFMEEAKAQRRERYSSSSISIGISIGIGIGIGFFGFFQKTAAFSKNYGFSLFLPRNRKSKNPLDFFFPFCYNSSC